MDLLVFLVEQRGRLVTREQIVNRIWGDQVHIDTVNGINTAIRKIRNVLKDDPVKPKFLETVPGKGYRFIAQVTTDNGAETEDLETSQVDLPSSAVGPARKTAEGFVSVKLRLRGHAHAKYRHLVVSSLLAVFALTVFFIFRFQPAPHLTVSAYSQLTNDAQNKAGGILLTDGARVYCVETGPNGLVLAGVATAGGGTDVTHLLDGYTGVFDLSRPHWELLAGRSVSGQENGDLWVLSPGKSPHRIGNLKANAANWSPDGQRLAFTLHGNVYVAKGDGSQSRQIAAISGDALWPRWSPDGKRLRFTENNYNPGEVWESIWEVAADGSNLHRLLEGWNNPPHECCGSWTPDGKFFVFQSTHEGRPDLWTLSENGRGIFRRDHDPPVRLSFGTEGYSFPLVSIDGKQIFAMATQRRGELVRYDAKLREFVPFLGGISATWVSFTKSGNSVVYIEYPDLTVWRANADGSNKTQITFAPLQADGISWSPDEQWFALRARTPDKPWMIYLVPAQGGEIKPLAPSESEQGVPTWSADGRLVAFGDVPPSFGKASGKEMIHIFSLDTHAHSELPGSQGLWTARWSPDGRSLAALTIAGQQLMLYDFPTKKWRATKTGNVNNPTWSGDCKYVYFDTAGADRTLRRVRVSDGHIDELTSLHSYSNLAWWWSGVTPDSSPMILRNLGTTEIYSLSLEYR
jgi:Tol biopolymer transport system component/DNA-binding winged helix-turn-helix (wHTH) protein